MKPGIDVCMSKVIVDMSNDLWFRGLEVKAEEMRDRTPKTKAHLQAIFLGTKPEENK